MHPRVFDTKRAVRLAAGAQLICDGGAVLYHGSWYGRLILADGVVHLPETGERAISFTRSARVAAYWSILPRDDVWGEVPTILVFDRAALNNRHRLEPHHYYGPSSPFGCFPPVGYYDEMEERVVDRDITNVHRYLRGVVVLDPSAIQLAAFCSVAKGIELTAVRSGHGKASSLRQPTGQQLELDLV